VTFHLQGQGGSFLPEGWFLPCCLAEKRTFFVPLVYRMCLSVCLKCCCCCSSSCTVHTQRWTAQPGQRPPLEKRRGQVCRRCTWSHRDRIASACRKTLWHIYNNVCPCLPLFFFFFFFSFEISCQTARFVRARPDPPRKSHADGTGPLQKDNA